MDHRHRKDYPLALKFGHHYETTLLQFDTSEHCLPKRQVEEGNRISRTQIKHYMRCIKTFTSELPMKKLNPPNNKNTTCSLASAARNCKEPQQNPPQTRLLMEWIRCPSADESPRDPCSDWTDVSSGS